MTKIIRSELIKDLCTYICTNDYEEENDDDEENKEVWEEQARKLQATLVRNYDSLAHRGKV